MNLNLKSRPIVICSEQRSGTTALQRSFFSSGDVTNYSEIFHTADSEYKALGNFYHWSDSQGSMKPFRGIEGVRKAFHKYLVFLSELSDKLYFIIDIKYNSWHHFNAGWYDSRSQPLMMTFIKELNIPILHVVRVNSFLKYLSAQYASASGVWHHDVSSEVKADALMVTLQPQAVKYKMESSKQSVENFRAHLVPYRYSEELIYEDMFDGIDLTAVAKEKISMLISEEWVQKLQTSLKKNPVNPKDIVGNIPELVEAFRSTEFQWMINESLL